MSEFVPFDRVIILALDSVCWEVLLPLVSDRTMPALAAFLQKAHYGVLESTVPPHTAAAWTTFLTGKDPGHHGVLDFVSFDPLTHRFRFHDSSTHRGTNFLTRLCDTGISCGAIFLPRNYPPYALRDGYIVSGFETPGTQARFTEPDELRDEVLGVSPNLHFNFDEDWEDDAKDAAFARNIERAVSAVDVLERLSVHFQRERPTQVQIAYLQATDILFHKAWKWCRAETSTGHAVRHELVKKFFRRVDQLINRVFGLHSSASQRSRFSDKTKILRVICSDHGQCLSAGRVFVNSLLREWGYLRPIGHLRRASHQLSLLTMDAATRRARSRELLLDWSRTKAYMAHVGIYGFVYLNLKGREPNGIVTPEQYESVREGLIKRFVEEKIPGTNDPLFKQVWKGEQLYARKQELQLPDLVVAAADGWYPRAKLARGAVRPTPHAVGGVHRPEGVYAFAGQGIVPTPGLGARANLVDIAPTMMAALGRPVPASMTGKPLLQLFNPPPTVTVAADDAGEQPRTSERPVYTKAEEREIEKRLADLGYLE